MIIDGHAHAFGDYLTAESIAETLDAAGTQQVVLSPGDSARGRGYRLPDLATRWPERDLMYVVNRVVRAAIALTGKAGNIVPGNERSFGCDSRDPTASANATGLTRGPRTRWRSLIGASPSGVSAWSRCTSAGRHSRLMIRSSRTLQPGVVKRGYRSSPICTVAGTFPASSRSASATAKLSSSSAISSALLPSMRTCAGSTNVYIDTSPPQLVGAERIVAAVRRFGSGRIIMGSDTPYGSGNLRRAIERIDSLPLRSSDKDLVLGGNLAGVLDPAVGGLAGAPAGQPRGGGRA